MGVHSHHTECCTVNHNGTVSKTFTTYYQLCDFLHPQRCVTANENVHCY
uniref:Uncharacterized protein n=1 Tax=Anguilla anguilla TaxID=7936 RepID=A0A0E9X6I2_ANGAN